MSRVVVDDEKLYTIAQAIRDTTGHTKPFTLDAMAAYIPDVYASGQKNIKDQLEPMNDELESCLTGLPTEGQTWYDAFWDAIYKKLNSGSYLYTRWFYTFAGLAWNDDTFKPPFDIKPDGNGIGMFYSCGISNLKKILEEQGVELDTSRLESASNLFRNSAFLTHVPKIDLSNAKTIDAAFYTCDKLLVIDEIVFSEITGTTSAGSIFNGTNSVYRCTASGSIAVSISIKDLKKLDKTSITSFMNTLSPTVTGKTFTLSKEAVNNAFGIDVDDETTYPEGSEWYELRNSKSNWTISFV